MASRIRLPKVAGRQASKVAPTKSSYNATGIAQAPNLGTAEVGSSQPVRIQELVPELASSFSRLLTYTKMMNDAGVDVSMRATKTPILGADFFVEPCSADPLDIQIAEFVKDNLMEGMNAPFLSSLEDVLHFFEDGYSVLEKVYENRSWTPDSPGANGKNYTMLKSLAVRPPATITGIEYDNNGNAVKLTQNAIQADKTTQTKDLDFTKCLVFTFNRSGGDLTGKSLLRTAYPHWYYKTHLYKIDAIQKERHGIGVPRGKLKPGYTENDKKTLRTLLRNIRANEESFIMETPNVEIDFAELSGNLVNVLESADHHNVMILLNVMVQFLSLGVAGPTSGSRAVGGTQSDIFLKALRYVANYICDVINMHLIPELVVYNFKSDDFPKLRVRNMGETRDLQMLGAALANLMSQGGLTTDEDTENWIRHIFDMPRKMPGAAAIDPNAKQQAPVTLYTADGEPVQATPVATNGNQATNGNSNGNAPQKGAVKQNGGQGNSGKGPSTALSEHHFHLPDSTHQIEHHTPVTNENHYEFAMPAIEIPETKPTPVELVIEEGAIQAPAPIVHIHMPNEATPPAPIQAKSAIVTKNEDGTTTVEYEYGEAND